jgi:hydrogenase maturation protein HypF
LTTPIDHSTLPTNGTDREGDDHPDSTLTIRRVRLRVEGQVQGVGFRARARHLATSLGLSGFVRNVASHVEAEVEGDPRAIDRFLELLATDLPPRARIERIRTDEIPPTGDADFAVSQSRAVQSPGPLIAPDRPPCKRCREELFDRTNRRYRYAFINCCECGPRFTVADRLPFERRHSAMASFTMCPDCQREYDDTASQRFHSQVNGCPECGPTLRLITAGGESIPATPDRDVVAIAASALREGGIVAIKSVGGYQFFCLANDDAAVGMLRDRKGSGRKPFAVMVRDVAAALRLVEADPSTTRIFSESAGPIVLAPRRRDAPIAGSIAPGLVELGVVMPFTPLHLLLIAGVGEPLAITSGNRSGEPMVIDDETAVARLGEIADLILLDSRPIRSAVDASVVRPVAGTDRHRTQVIRRSCGLVPGTISLPHDTAPLIACGAEFDHTFSLASGRRTFVSQPLGDLSSDGMLDLLRSSVTRAESLLGVTPRFVVRDADPDSISTKYSRERRDLTAITVQHHHAHFAACLAEHEITHQAIGVIYDGPGTGLDGSTWGGEFLVGGIAESRRAGHLRPIGLSARDAAIRHPWQLGCAWLTDTAAIVPPLPAVLRAAVDPDDWHRAAESSRSAGALRTSAMSDLLDAMAALTGLVSHASYRGQGAAEFEAAADLWEWSSYTIDVQYNSNDMVILDPRPMVLAVARDAARGWSAGSIGARVHSAIAIATLKGVRVVAEATGLDTVVLSGSVFQNRRLLVDLFQLLSADRLRVVVPSTLPVNDGGISYGQAAAAAARLALLH